MLSKLALSASFLSHFRPEPLQTRHSQSFIMISSPKEMNKIIYNMSDLSFLKQEYLWDLLSYYFQCLVPTKSSFPKQLLGTLLKTGTSFTSQDHCHIVQSS